MAEFVNQIIDAFLATADRILQLPLFMVLLLAALVTGVCGWGLARIWRRPERAALRRRLLVTEVAVVVLLVAWLADRRIAAMQLQLSELRARLVEQLAAVQAAAAAPTGQSPATAGPVVPAATATAAPRTQALFDVAKAQLELAEVFDGFELRPSVLDDATDFVHLSATNPRLQACLAVVDLDSPGLQLEIGADLQHKSLTSTFARQRHCTIAINGEAGNSPAPDSGLGSWSGHLVQNGTVLLREQPGNPRPFLCFDHDNHGRFVAMSANSREVPDDAVNVIFGRLDVLVDGSVELENARNRQPRTAMAIDRDGRLLYLLVVDGRQPRASMGLTRAEVGVLLKSCGAHAGMLCDEGGSSCIYVDKTGGIANVPSDDQGEERPTYTHFGVRRTGS